MKKTIKDYELKEKKVIIRVDFNVPIKNKKIEDDTRIKASLETISYAIENGAKVILLSHLGRVKSEEDKELNDLYPVSVRLQELLGQPIVFVNETRGEAVESAINLMKCGDVILLQNTRYEDIDGKKESSNDLELGAYWASLGNLFINDAFGTAHRTHASNVGIASHLPNGIGFLIEKELKELEGIVNNPQHPFAVILGGSKVSDKIGVIENLANKADYILIGGGMAYTFLHTIGMNIESSLFDKDSVEFCQDILKKYPNKIILPIDSVNALEITDKAESRTCFINEFKNEEIGLDIGYGTVKLFKQYLEKCKTILWNGPVGVFEIEAFSKGTKAILDILKEIDATKVIGGGDTVSAVNKFGEQENMTHMSTGGGASLELLEGKILPGIEIINEK